jgi:preprotein translocase subunit SecF
MRFFKKPSVNFIGVRRRAATISAIVIIAGGVSVGIHSGFNTSIDFAGGTLVEVRFEEPVEIGGVRSVVEAAGFSGAEVTHFGSRNEVLIKAKSIGDMTTTTDIDTVVTEAAAARQIEAALKAEYGEGNIDMRRIESVGPKIGDELKSAAFFAILYSLLGIVVYISWRFEFRFAIAAIIALIHDVLITLGFFSVTDREVSIPVIAAVLTIVGYSLNDTIVVFDRIRENLRSRKREGYMAVVNASINETLSRTVITSLTTAVVVVCLAVLGGAVINDFALTLLVGVLVGTYSSIFIAENWRNKRRKQTTRKK